MSALLKVSAAPCSRGAVDPWLTKHEDGGQLYSRCGPALLSRQDYSSNTRTDVSKLCARRVAHRIVSFSALVSFGRTCHISAAQIKNSYVHATVLPKGPVVRAAAVSSGVRVRMEYTALFAVRDAPSGQKHVIAFPQQGTPFRDLCTACTRSCQRCTAAHCLAPCS